MYLQRPFVRASTIPEPYIGRTFLQVAVLSNQHGNQNRRRVFHQVPGAPEDDGQVLCGRFRSCAWLCCVWKRLDSGGRSNHTKFLQWLCDLARSTNILTTLLQDIDGREIIDLACTMSAGNFGHCHPVMTKAVKDSIDTGQYRFLMPEKLFFSGQLFPVPMCHPLPNLIIIRSPKFTYCQW